MTKPKAIQLVPDERPLDQEKALAALIKYDGNVSQAAKALGVASDRLRLYCQACPALRRALEETLEQGVDLAIAVLFEGLRDQTSYLTRFYAAKEFLRSQTGRRRGFGPRELGPAMLEVKSDRSTGQVTLKWLEPPKEG